MSDNGCTQEKRLLYVMRCPLGDADNLKAKFNGQMNALRDLGFDVFYIAYDQKNLYLIHGEQTTVVGKTHFSFPNYIHTFFYRDLHRAVIRVIRSRHFSFVYWRKAPVWHSTYQMMKAAKECGSTVICEIPTYLKNSKETTSSIFRKLFSLYSTVWNRRVRRLTDHYLLLGDPAPARYHGKPAVNIDNGVDASCLPVRSPFPHPGEVHILCLSSMCYWHGYDRLIRSLASYQGDTKVTVHMVGGNAGGLLPEWKALAEKLNVDDRICFHGALYGEKLTEIFDLCDIGVCSLGAYRKGLEETSELKAREFVSRGLPFVTAVSDPSMEDFDERFRMRVSNDDSVPDLQAIVEFALQANAVDDHPQILHAYAAAHMTWTAQYRKSLKELGIL